MNAFVAIDQLGDALIAGQAAEHVGVLGRKAGQFADRRDHLAQCLLRGVVEIRVLAHGDEMRIGLAKRKTQAVSFVQRAGQRLLDGSKIDLAVTLHSVAIAGREQRALLPNRKIHCRAYDRLDQIIVEVLPQLDLLDAHLKHVAGLSPFDGDRPVSMCRPSFGFSASMMPRCSGRMPKEAEDGNWSGPPEMELIVTVSPYFIVQTGGSALSKKPQ